MSSTDAALARALDGDASDWTGLGEDVDDEQLARTTHGERNDAGWARLSGMEVPYRDYPGAGLRRAFFDDADRAFLIWTDGPFDGVDACALHAALGDPQAHHEQTSSRHAGTQQWIWANRGVTAYVFGDEVVGLALYRQTDVDYYLRWLGGRQTSPYRPMPGAG